jgi:hypothetical protein
MQGAVYVWYRVVRDGQRSVVFIVREYIERQQNQHRRLSLVLKLSLQRTLLLGQRRPHQRPVLILR